ncbi:hypothetical protein Pst134EA_000182 [Puccinia striiformis f. sp. tritici]|uniref:hypothetical protein n=1 Tax=Puccinia striiformis f. sp. tritici TaxID=168172 RepID=UPI0020074E5F|nr:hypothetical protein Pst134EA_000182 [Puccinia striiformis f. sp. tritici]KAH9473102.1 hypothetical protein Pst134EA_000182 [Puccinia striiformis f. sp. tritici]
METLPNEFLSHHLPLMFFAGIEPQNAIIPPANPSTPPGPASPTKPSSKDPFEGLIENLRAVLAPKPSHPSIWIPRKTPQPTSDYRVLLVPKSIRFPPRKTRPSSASSTTSANAVSHSPLSPLSQTSPLFPDGIMTPIWIRKHRDMIPSVFVLTLRLWEPPQSSSRSTQADEHPHRPECEKYDLGLIQDITERKKTTIERGIKLAVIILTSRYMLDNPQLDTRLSYIRKKSSLDTRASLFVLSPVPAHDVVNFVHTLKAELYESTIDYYREHSRRVRRKRSRSSSNAFSQSTSYHQAGQPVITPLGAQGWSVRRDYKLATFAEFRQEYEVAIKSYEDCWEGLLQMFNSTAVLPPRTKRWAEAKVLIDCINFKISKLYLYLNEPTRAMYQFNKHIHKFRELCNGWGIGDETYEFWAWLSKQYTVLGDLVDIGCRNGMRLPNLCPPPILVNDKSTTGSPVLPESRLVGGGAVNLTGVLVHPGFYYYYGAQCAFERRSKFKISEAAEEEMRSIAEAKGESGTFQASLALAHERKINHGELIISLYTKAYEIFKTVGSNRMTLFIALKIALVHYHQNDEVTACKFFERIIPSYRKGSFNTILDSILFLSYQNLNALVTKTKDAINPGSNASAPHRAIELLNISLELLGKEVILASPTDDWKDICNTLAGLIQPLPRSPSSEAEVITLPIEPSAFPVRCQVAFWEPSIQLGKEVEFQVTFKIPRTFANCQPTIGQISLQFTSAPLLAIVHEPFEAKLPTQTLDVGTISEESLTHRLDLQVTGKSCWLITGRLKLSEINNITLERIAFRFNNIVDGRHFDFVITPDAQSDHSLDPALWIERFDDASNEPVFLHTESFESICKVQHKKPEVSFFINYEPCGILNKRQNLHIEILNQEQDSLNLKLMVKLQSPSTNDLLEMDNETHKIPGVLTIKMGSIKPMETLKKSITFLPTGLIGLRVLEMSLGIKPTGDDHKTHEINDEEDKDKGVDVDDDDDQRLESLRGFKIIRQAHLDIEEPIQIRSNTQHFHQPHHSTDQSFFKSSNSIHRMNLNLLISNSSAQTHPNFLSLLNSIKIQSAKLSLEKASCRVKMLSCSLSDNGSQDLDIDLKTGNSFAISYIVEIEVDPVQEKVAGCFVQVIWSCSSANGRQESHSKQIPLEIDIPITAPIRVLTDLKPRLKLMEPVEVNYTIENRDPTRTADLVLKISESQTNGRKESSVNNEWILSGPKLMNSIVVLPQSCKVISLIGIPTKLGQISGPKLEVFQRISRPFSDQQQLPSLSSLKDLQDLDSVFDGVEGNNNPVSQPNTSKLVPLEIFRSFTVIDKPSSRNDSNIGDDQLRNQHRVSRNTDQSLTVLVFPA